MSLSERLMVVWNFGIVFGYFLMAGVMLVGRVRFPQFVSFGTMVAGFAFFTLCAGTHLEMVFHLVDPEIRNDSMSEGMTSSHMHVIHALQACSIIAFAFFSRDAVGRAIRFIAG